MLESTLLKAIEGGEIPSSTKVICAGEPLTLDEFVSFTAESETEFFPFFEYGSDEKGADSGDSKRVLEVTTYRVKHNFFGAKRIEYECPQCETQLRSGNMDDDVCPNCRTSFRFSRQPSSVDSKERASQLGEKRSPGRQWVITAVILCGIIFPLMGHTMFSAVMTDSTGLCAVIFCLFIAALIRNFLDIRFISTEVAAASEQIQALIARGNIKAFVTNADPSLLREHVTNLYEISRRSAEVSQDNLIVLLQSRINSRIRITEIAGGVLVTLGLVGTILGLIASFGGIDTVLGNLGEDKSELLDGFTATLQGMGTAFYTTLLGSILGGVILRLLSSVVDTNADALVAQIAELSEVYILPTLRKSAAKRKI